MKFCPECGNDVISKVLDGVERIVCIQCDYINWQNPIPVVAALVKYNGQYLVARNTEWDEGIFSLIAGYLESGEDIEAAILREVQEELSLKGSISHFIGYYSLLEKNQIILAFEIEATGTLKTNHELAETLPLSAHDLANYDFSYFELTTKIINDWKTYYNLIQKREWTQNSSLNN